MSINLNPGYLGAFELSGELRKTFGLAGAILGALHGGFLDVLVTNELTAIRLLGLR